MIGLFDVLHKVEKSAVISDCGAYRYSLTRKWGDGALLPFIMLNPSTADAEQDDPTIRRCMGFARREGAGGIVVANLFAFRSPSPAALFAADDPAGPQNWLTLCRLAVQATEKGVPIICAWGAHGHELPQATGAQLMFEAAEVALRCLGRTKNGSPRHPLYVRADQPLESFP